MSLPEGYDSIHATGMEAFAVAHAREWLAEVLGGGETLHGWAAGLEGREALSGRGVVYSVPAPTTGPDGRDRWAVRHYRRGGAVAALLVDRYLAVGEPRPIREVAAAAVLRERGIPTPAVVAGAIYRTGLWYRADLVTELVPGGADLAHVVFGSRGGEAARGGEDARTTSGSSEGAESALRAAGELVGRMGRAGVEHVDLNAKNILLTSGDHGPRAYVVDLDRCRVEASGTTAGAAPMRRRLERSLRKFESATGRVLSPGEWAALRHGVEAGS